MRRQFMQFTVMAVVCAVAGGAAFADATIADDQTEGCALISGTEAFSAGEWDADVDYAVYAPGQYPGSHIDKDINYIYAYQIFNDSASTATLSHLSVGLGEDAGAANPRFDDGYGVSGGIFPALSWLVGTPPGSVQWTGAQWAPSTHSTVLLFSSPNSYTFDSATLVNHGTSDTQSLPSPVPEPATLLLLCGGVVPILLKHRRKARVKV